MWWLESHLSIFWLLIMDLFNILKICDETMSNKVTLIPRIPKWWHIFSIKGGGKADYWKFAASFSNIFYYMIWIEIKWRVWKSCTVHVMTYPATLLVTLLDLLCNIFNKFLLLASLFVFQAKGFILLMR